MRALIICAWCLAALAARADEASALGKLKQCANEADQDIAGIVKLEAACPGVHAALVELSFDLSLHRGWQSGVSTATLDDLLALHARYAEGHAEAEAPAVNSLQSVLEELKQTAPEPKVSWWELVKGWLRHIFAPEPSDAPNWWQRILENIRISDAVIRVIGYGLIALVIGMALAVIFNELRAAGIFRKRATLAGAAKSPFSTTRTTRSATIDDLETMPWRERPALLLELLSARLIKLRRLRAERSLTHRELSRAVQFSQADDRERFANVALLAESLRFGRDTEHQAASAQAQSVVADGRALLARLATEAGA